MTEAQGTGSATLLGLLQGLTEFLPVSSSGHLAAAQLVAPVLTHPGVTLELATHVGTTLAVVIYYRSLLIAILRGDDADPALLGLSRRHWILLLGTGTVPTALIGFLARDAIRHAFDSPVWIAGGWALTGVVLMVSPRRARNGHPLTVRTALLVGVAQGLATFPGVSRSGLTITAALLLGAESRQAVTYSLLLSIPAILGATVLDAVQLAVESAPTTLLLSSLLFATLAAGIVGFLCIGLVHRATRTGWWPHFAWYCWLAALGLLVAVR